MSIARTILIAHRQAAIRDRFAAALADARHLFVTADTAETAVALVSDREKAVSLVLLDLALDGDGVELVKALGRGAGRPLPIVVFAGTVGSAEAVRSLLARGVAGYINEHAATPQILPALAPHLFPESFDRRTSPRVALGVPISYRTGQTIAGALTLNIGKGGVGIRTMSPLPPESDVELKFLLPDGTHELEARGCVAWSDRKVGMGIRFEHIDPAAQAAIDAFVDQHR